MFLLKDYVAEDFLVQMYKNVNIFPDDWLPVKTQSNLPVLPAVNFDGGYNLQVVENKITIQITYPKPVKLTGDFGEIDELHKIAKSIYSNLKSIPVVAVGINFKILKIDASLANLSKGMPTETNLQQIKFESQYNGFTKKTDMILAKEKEQPNRDSVLIVTNFHIDVEPNENIIEIINKRNNCFKNLKAEINHVKF